MTNEPRRALLGPESPPGAGRPGAAALGAVLGTAGLAAGSRAWLLLRDDTASGYDAWYYVLQVRSWSAGAPLFADDSALFPALVTLTRLTGGDAVLADELAATGFAAVATGLGAVAGARLGGAPGALVAGAVFAGSTGHLSLSAEFLKNAAGLVPLAAVLAVVVGPRSRAGWGLAAAAIGAAVLLHKLSGAVALAVALAVLAGSRVSLARLSAGAVLAAGAALAGVLRVVDLGRGLGGGELGRFERLTRSSLTWPELVELGLVHLAPLLVAAAWSRGVPRPTLLVLGALGVGCAAPGLPFSFDELAWRLLCLGFVPLGLLLAACRPPAPLAALLAAAALAPLPWTVAAHARRTPDYAAWRSQLSLIRATVPPGDRVVAHRGLCGFVWAEGGVRCENFEPDGDPERWWRIAYGFSAERLAPWGEAVPLLPAYVLVHEPVWRRFREDEAGRWSLLDDPRNPHDPRPPFVYAPAPGSR